MKDLVRFLSEVNVELSRVVWPKFEEFFGTTVVVLVVVTVFALYLGALDFGFTYLARLVFEQYGA